MPNGAADKPRKVVKPHFPPEVGLIRVVVRRFAPRKQRIASAAPLSRARSVRDNVGVKGAFSAHAENVDP